MKKYTLAVIGLVFILLFSTACNLPFVGSRQSLTTSTQTVPIPITDLTGFYEDKITSGQWTPEQGLVTMLKLFAGETTGQNVVIPASVTETEGTGIIQIATEYLTNGKDETTKAEIRRLLQLMVPSRTTLDKYSVASKAMKNKSIGLAAPRPLDTDCASLWLSGFPDTRTPSYPCFQYDVQTIGRSTYQVYYPLDWRGDASKLPYYQATNQAVTDSVPTYSRYGDMKSIYFVFSILPNATVTGAAAVTFAGFFMPSEEACPVLIYPSALTLSIADYKQAIAHEIFHCFQAWNLRDQMLNATYDSSGWWVESSAEYFSNLVYPTTDFEYRFLNNFITLSNAHQMTEMKYENFLFFQYLGNLHHPEGVIAFLRGMPTSPGIDAQLAALSRTPGIDSIYQGFARDFIDNRIADSSGAIHPYVVTYWPGGATSAVADVPYKSFMLLRYDFNFPAGYRYLTNLTFPDSLVSLSGEPFDAHMAWTSFPDDMNMPCGDQRYKLSIVSTTPDSARHTFHMEVATSEEACNNCLVGAWELDNASYEPFFLAAFPTNPPILNGATGRLYARFAADGTLSGGYDNFMVDYIPQIEGVSSQQSDLDTQLTLNGNGTARYSTHDTTLSLTDSNFNIAVQVLMNGTVISGTTGISPGMSSIPLGDQGQFQCTGNTLTTTFPPEGGVTYPPLTWHRTVTVFTGITVPRALRLISISAFLAATTFTGKGR